MEKRKQKSLQCEIYDWLASMECAHIKKKCGIISFCNDIYEAVVIFHEDSLMELSVEDKKTGENCFYLHFEVTEMKSTKNNIQAFFDFFTDQKHVKEELDIGEVQSRQPMRLLISCTSGLTSAYFAYTMKNVLTKAGVDIIIDAVSYTEIDRVQERYDYILLAPQIAHKLPEYQKKYGNRVMAVDSRDFATYNTSKVFNWLAGLYRTKAA